MEQTKRGRARELEMRRFQTLLEGLPKVEKQKKVHERVIVEDIPHSRIEVASFLTSDCEIVNKCLEVFISLLEEVHQLSHEAATVYFPALQLFGEEAATNDSGDECAAIRLVSNFLPSLHSLSSLISRVNEVFRNLIKQIRAFHMLPSRLLPGASDRVLLKVWRALGELLAILIQLDEICLNRPAIRQHWQTYMRALETAQHNPSEFGITEDQLIPLFSSLALIEGHIMLGNGLRNCYEASYGDLDDDAAFSARMKHVITELYSKWEKAADVDVPEKRLLMIIVGLTVFYHLHFSSPDKKLIKKVWSCHKKVALFHLFADILWSPCHFLLREVGDLKNIVDKKSQALIQGFRSSVEIEIILDEAIGYLPTKRDWERELRLEIKKTNTMDQTISLRLAELVLKGARLADTMCRLLKTALNVPAGALKISKTTAYKVFQIVETVKSISQFFALHWRVLFEACQLASQQWRCHVLSILDRTRLSFRAARDAERTAAIQIAVNGMMHSASRTRLTVCSLALEFAQYQKTMRSVEANQLDGLLSRITTLLHPRELIQRVSDFSFLYFHPALFDIYWDTVLDRLPDITSFKCFSAAICDSIVFASKSQHGGHVMETFQASIYESMRNSFLSPLCALIETDLRVLTHTHLVVDERDKTSKEKYLFFCSIFREPQINLYDKVVDIKEFVSSYLEKTFYNLTAVALNDCHTYSKMAVVAEQRYGLELVSGDLPHHSIDRGLDILHVIRTLHTFTANYNYCINQQVFFEKTSPNRTLRVVTSAHMAASLQTHGTGILNTSVNIVYQLLRKKLNVLSQFLADEHIKAQLQRDRRHFEQNKVELKHLYPVKRAERFNRAISKLGLTEDEETYMDKFRQTVTQMGNGVGFVRSMTSAAASVGSQMKEYDVAEWEEFEQKDQTQDNQEDDGTQTLRHILSDMRTQAERNRDYIKLLLNVFRSGLSEGDNLDHLDNFFMLVPALMLNYMNHMLTCRARLQKRVQSDKEMTFVDDGFILGVAYLLSIFRQWRQFTSLNWMDSLKKKLQQDGATVTKELQETKDRRSDALRVNMVQDSFKEYQQMMYAFQSARVYFAFEDDSEDM